MPRLSSMTINAIVSTASAEPRFSRHENGV
jgi:hypothetical protein